MDTSQLVCPSCRALVSADMLSCQACGKPLKSNSAEISVPRRIFVYVISVLLPPFGFWYAWKYLRQQDKQSRIIGWVTIVLTIVSIIANTWITTVGYLSQFEQPPGVIDAVNF